MKPSSLLNLIDSLRKLPGISKKQAERIAYFVVKDEGDVSQSLIWSLEDIMKKIKTCKTCHHYTEKDVCDICTDKNRQRILVVVESPLEVFKFEESQTMKPYYHVIGGLINVKDEKSIDNLNINDLVSRVENYNEVILALSPNLEGIITSNVISKMLGKVKVTQLAQGIPLGAAMEYVDEITLKSAIDNRKEVK